MLRGRETECSEEERGGARREKERMVLVEEREY